MGDVFENYSDPEAEPLTQLPPKHLLYYNLGLKMPGGPIDEEETPRSDDEDQEEELPAAGGSEVKPMPSSYLNSNAIPTVNTIIFSRRTSPCPLLPFSPHHSSVLPHLPFLCLPFSIYHLPPRASCGACVFVIMTPCHRYCSLCKSWTTRSKGSSTPLSHSSDWTCNTSHKCSKNIRFAS